MGDKKPDNGRTVYPGYNLLRLFTGGVLPRTFAALRVRNYRLYWFGNAVSLVGTWMQNVARGWLVLELTNSPFLVGLETSITWLPALFISLPAGVLADHFNKRNLMVITQALLAVLALALAVLYWTGVIRIGHILVISALTGVIIAFNSPVRLAIVSELVGRDLVLNAVALNSAVFNAARIVGPSIAGVALGVIGAGGCFAINSVSFLGIIVALAFVRLKHARPEPTGESLWRRIAGGLRFVARHRDMRVLMVMIAVFSSFGIVYLPLMPVFARDVFGVGPGGYGAMMAGLGVGALTGVLVLATISRTRHRGRILVAGTTLLGLLLVLFGLVRDFRTGIAVLVALGFCQSSVA
ncbi:MAG TPA: MFS transporter, partial [candidate division WOR-3 bacterium]|nr:MFS transporter [candidate division WOR-3 bacterium]